MVSNTDGALDEAQRRWADLTDQAYAPSELRETFVIASFDAMVFHRQDAYEWARLHGVTQILPITIVNHPDRKGGLVGFGITRQRLLAVLRLFESETGDPD